MIFNDILANLDNFDCQQLAKLNAESARAWNEKNKQASFSFKKGDKVRFGDADETVRFGTVIRRGQKAMKVEVVDGRGDATVWAVNPYRLKHTS